MITAALVFAGLAAFLHVYIFTMESLTWTSPRTRATFRHDGRGGRDHQAARVEPRLLPTSRSSAACRPPSRRPPATRLGALVIVVPAVGGIAVGLMARYGSEKAIPGARDARGDGAGALQPEPHPGAADPAEAPLGGNRHRDRRALRRRGHDHRHGGRARLARGPARPRDRGRAQDAARRRRGRGDGENPWLRVVDHNAVQI